MNVSRGPTGAGFRRASPLLARSCDPVRLEKLKAVRPASAGYLEFDLAEWAETCGRPVPMVRVDSSHPTSARGIDAINLMV